MDRATDMLRAAAKQIEHPTGRSTTRAQLAYTLGAGLTCMLAVGLALCAHVGFEAIVEAFKPDARKAEGTARNNPESNGGGVPASPQKGSSAKQRKVSDANVRQASDADLRKASGANLRGSSDAVPQSGQCEGAYMRAALWREKAASDTVKRFYALQNAELAKYKLSITEQQIAILILHGESNRDIAEYMHLAESTIKKHVQRILSKTGTTNRKEFFHIIQAQVERRPF